MEFLKFVSIFQIFLLSPGCQTGDENHQLLENTNQVSHHCGDNTTWIQNLNPKNPLHMRKLFYFQFEKMMPTHSVIFVTKSDVPSSYQLLHATKNWIRAPLPPYKSANACISVRRPHIRLLQNFNHDLDFFPQVGHQLRHQHQLQYQNSFLFSYEIITRGQMIFCLAWRCFGGRIVPNKHVRT